MKTVWKWILGIVIALVVIGLVVGAVLLVRHYLPMTRVAVQARPGYPQRGFDGRGFGGPGFGMRGFGMPGYGMHGFGMMGRGFSPFGMLIPAIFDLGLLVLVVLGVVWLVRSFRTPKPAVEMKTCASCGKPVQADWRNCPYCGKKQ